MRLDTPPTRLTPLHLLLAGERSGERSAGSPVCHDGQRFVRWREFAAQVGAQATAFKARPESRWLLVNDHAQQFAASFLALLHAGKQIVIPPNAQAGTLAGLVATFDAVAADAVNDLATASAAPLSAIDPEAAIIDLYTSGSSGEPKRVRKTLAQFEAEVCVLEGLWGRGLGDARIAATAPHQHIYGLLFRLLWPLSAGRIFDALTCADPDLLARRLAVLGQGGRRCVLVSSPAQLSRLPSLVPLASLRPALTMIFSSGGPLSAATAAEFRRQLDQAPTEIFGSTETGGIAWRRQDDGDDSFTPFPGVAVDAGDDGALWLRSPLLPDDRAWRLDDAVDVRADGRFRLCGRLDRIVKVEEKRLSLPELEKQLLAHRWVVGAAAQLLLRPRQCVGVAVVLSAAGRQQLAAHGKRATVQLLRRHLGEHFEAVLLPRHWRFPDDLPTDARGKLTHQALATLFDAGSAEPAGCAAAAEPSSALLQPEVLDVGASGDAGDRVVLQLHVPPALAHFPGHFPGLPILPGVVQIDWAIRLARAHLPLFGPFFRPFTALENIKFLALVLPDARLELTLSWDAVNARLDFLFATSARKHSSGRIVFGAGT